MHQSPPKKNAKHLRPLAGLTRSIAQSFSPVVRNFLVWTGFRRKVTLMRYRAKPSRIKVSEERRREHSRALALIVAIISIPVLGAILVVVSTTKPDLSELIPSNKQVGEYIVLSWPELLQAKRNELNSAAANLSGAKIRALGYIVDGDKAIHPGDLVQHFVLLPDAGNFLDPAHRYGDQMVSVSLKESDRIPFSPRRLVWVWGTFRASPGDPSGRTPLYSLKDARAQVADPADIGQYFQ
jgi:hypothetical protein